MYRFVSAVGVLYGFNQRWSAADIANTPVNELYLQYRQLWITLVVDPDTTKKYLDLSKIKTRYVNFTGTISDLLLDNGNASFPLETTVPDIRTNYARYSDAHRCRYKIDPIHPLYGENVDLEQRTALRMIKNDLPLSYSDFVRKCIVSVNGFWHLCDTDGKSGIVVYDGGTTFQKTLLNQCGIYSFADIGNIQCVPIKADMIHKRLTPEMISGQAPTEPYSHSAYLSIPGDLSNKTVLLVLGGYFHSPISDIFSKVSDNEFKINFSKYPFVDRYYESSKYMNLDSLGLDSTVRNPSQIDLNQLWSDETLLRYMTLSQSFLIVVDAPELFVEKRYIRKTGRPGTYISFEEPKFPIVSGIGRMPEYWWKKENYSWPLWCYNDVIRPKIYNTMPDAELTSVKDAATTTPIDPEITNGVYFLAIGRDVNYG